MLKPPPEPPESNAEGIIADLQGNIRDMELERLRDEVDFWHRFKGWFCINDEDGGSDEV